MMLSQLNVRVMDNEFILFMQSFGWLGTVVRLSLVICMPSIALSSVMLAFDTWSLHVGVTAATTFSIGGAFVLVIYIRMVCSQARAMQRLHVRNRLSGAVARFIEAGDDDDDDHAGHLAAGTHRSAHSSPSGGGTGRSGGGGAYGEPLTLDERLKNLPVDELDPASQAASGMPSCNDSCCSSPLTTPRSHPCDADLSEAAARAAAAAARRVREHRKANFRAAVSAGSSSGRGAAVISGGGAQQPRSMSNLWDGARCGAKANIIASRFAGHGSAPPSPLNSGRASPTSAPPSARLPTPMAIGGSGSYMC